MLLISLVSNNLSNYGSRHFKLFTNCQVSWDTLYQNMNYDWSLIKNKNKELASLSFPLIYFKLPFKALQLPF